MSFEGGTSKGRLEFQDKPRFKKRVSNQFPFIFHKARNNRVSNPNSQKARNGNSPTKKPTCSKCCKKHWGECLVAMDKCFGCCNSVDKLRDWPNIKIPEKGSVKAQAQASATSSEAPKRNHFYALI